MRILHIVDSLSVNGRTILLQELTRSTAPAFEHLIVTLRNSGTLTDRFNEMGINVYALNAYKPFRNPKKTLKVITHIFRFKPNICLCWSGDSNLFSVTIRAFGIPVVWTIHNSTDRWNTIKTRYGVRFAAFLSKFVPDKIICCSNKTYEVYHKIHRYCGHKLHVVTNGVDVKKFQPSRSERDRVRKMLDIPDKALVVSTAARIELAGHRSQGDFKDLETLFKAAAIVCHHRKDTFFLLFGLNLTYENEQLVGWLEQYNLKSNVKLLGFQRDVAGLFAASDIFAMSSTSGEGLPISLLEAMACGAIPVCTDSGDIALAVGSAGFVVPQKDATKLSDLILKIAEYNDGRRYELSQRAVDAIKKSYTIEPVAQRYIDILIDVATSPHSE